MAFGLMIVPMVMMVGSAIDIASAVKARSDMQAAADAAALAAASMPNLSTGERETLALSMMSANAQGKFIENIGSTVTLTETAAAVEVTGAVGTGFLGVMGLNKIELKAYAKAKTWEDEQETGDGEGSICLLALDPDSTDSIHIQGANEISYRTCWAYSNSTQATAINSNGSNATARGQGHCAVGGYDPSPSNPNGFSPNPQTGCMAVADPFATVSAYDPNQAYQANFVAPAIPNNCRARNLRLRKNAFTLQPGRYCGGINIQAQATVHLQDGIYVIEDGEFNVQGGATVTGTNVLLYFTGPRARAQIIGGGTITLTGREAGETYEGFLMIADADANRDGESNIQGGGDAFDMEGIIYMPTQRIEVSGNGDINTRSRYFAMIAKDFYFRGNGEFHLLPVSSGSDFPDLLPRLPTSVKQAAHLIE